MSPRRRLVAGVLAVLALLGGSPAGLAYHAATEPSDGTVASFQPVDPPRELGDLRFGRPEGTALRLSDLRGRVVLLNVWATWCPPCIRELPGLDTLAGRVAGAEGIAVVALSVDRDGAPVARPFFERLRVRHLELLVDPEQSIGWALPVDVLPASYLLDRDGRLIGYLRSYVDWAAPAAEALLRELAASPQPRLHAH
ncbi:MAG: TlpA family protein disulfide reductase [Ectothiorhodospiraceae bacterium]|nr:TlpA family protein disulfide reductase [Ectothiorhodospiraceae bacterium]